jgi:hypothetical protein
MKGTAMHEALRTAGFAFASSRDRLQRLGRRIEALAGGCEARVQALMQSLERLPQAATFEPFAVVGVRSGSAAGAAETGGVQDGQRARGPRATAARGGSVASAAPVGRTRTQGLGLLPDLIPKGDSSPAQRPGWHSAAGHAWKTTELPSARGATRGQGAAELGRGDAAVPPRSRQASGAVPSGSDATATPMPWLPRSAQVDAPAMPRSAHAAASASLARAAFASWAAQHPAAQSSLPAQQVLQQQLAALEAPPAHPAAGAPAAAWPMPPHADRGAAAAQPAAAVPTPTPSSLARPAVLSAAAAARLAALEPAMPRAASRLLPPAPAAGAAAAAHESHATALPAEPQAQPDEDALLDAMNHRLIDQAWLRGVDLR